MDGTDLGLCRFGIRYCSFQGVGDRVIDIIRVEGNNGDGERWNMLAVPQVADPVARTFQSYDCLTLGGLRLDAPEYGRQELTHARFYVVLRVPRHEDVRVGVKSLSTALGAAALAVDDLLDAVVELRLPGVGGDIGIVAVENVVDGVCTARAIC